MISLARYRRLFATPELQTMLAASIVARLPIGMAALALLLFVQQATGSVAHAGTASGLYVLGLATVAPALGRLMDRAGPRRLLAATAALYPALLVAFVWLLDRGAPLAATGLCALAAGAAFPPVSVCVRATLPRLVHDESLLHTAYSVDSVLVELVFIVGPALVAMLAGAGAVRGAIVLAAACAGVGALLFARTSVVRHWRAAPEAGDGRGLLGPLRSGVMRVILAVTFLYSVAFGLFEVGAVAAAAASGTPAAAGWLLALASVGSATGALIYGSRAWHAPPSRLWVAALGAMTMSILVMSPLASLPALMAASLVAGAPMATVIATQSVLISRRAPAGMLAESFTWGATCLLGGVSAGMAAGGLLAEAWSAGAVFAAAAAVTACATLLAAIRLSDA